MLWEETTALNDLDSIFSYYKSIVKDLQSVDNSLNRKLIDEFDWGTSIYFHNTKKKHIQDWRRRSLCHIQFLIYDIHSHVYDYLTANYWDLRQYSLVTTDENSTVKCSIVTNFYKYLKNLVSTKTLLYKNWWVHIDEEVSSQFLMRSELAIKMDYRSIYYFKKLDIECVEFLYLNCINVLWILNESITE